MKKALDYYAILDVPCDASPEAVRSAYRRLMMSMKMHPDLGGDHDIASQINEAYAVLSDEAKRKEYARTRLFKKVEEVRGRTVLPPPEKQGTELQCPWCSARSVQLPHSDARCERCQSPLSPPPTSEQLGPEIGSRRMSLRAVKNNPGTIHFPGRGRGVTVRMRDLSLTGISFFSETPLNMDQVLRFSDPTLDAVISVVSCRPRRRLFSIHARLLTVAFHNKERVFVSATG